MAVVGTAYVNIRALTNRLESDVEKAFSKLRDVIDVKVGADTSAAMAKIEEVLDAADASEANIRVTADTAQASGEIDEVVTASNRRKIELAASANTILANRQLAFAARSRTVDLILNLNKASVANVAATIKALSGARLLGNYFTHLSDTMKNLDKNIMRISGWAPSIATVFSAITSGVGGIATVGTDLFKAMGFLWAAPGVFAGFAAGLTATYIGLKDMSKVLGDLGPQFQRLGSSMSASFWKQAEAPIRNMVKTLFPQLSTGMKDVSRATGNFFGSFATGLSNAMKGGALASILKNVADSTDIASKSMGDFTSSFTVITQAGAAYLPRLATWWRDLNSQFNEFITKAASDGSLDQWIEDGITGMKQIGSILMSTVSIFGSIDKAARAAGGGGLTRLTENMSKFAAIMETPVFQKTLTHFFAGADSAMTSLAAGFGILGGGIAKIGPEIQQSLTIAGDAVKGLLTNLSLIISDPAFATGMVGMFDGFRDAIKSLEPAMAPLGAKFGALMGFAGMMAREFAPVIASAIIALAPVFMGLVDFLTPVVKTLTTGLRTIIEAAAPFAEQFGAALSGLGQLISANITPITGVIAVVVAGIAAMIPTIVTVVAGIFSFVGAVTGFITQVGGMSVVLQAAKGVLAALFGPIGLIIGGLVTLYTTSADFRNSINNLIGTIAPFIGQLVSGLLPPIMSLASSLFPALVGVLQVVGTTLGGVVSAVAPLVGQLLGALVPVVTNLAQTIFPALGQIIGALVQVIGPLASIIGTVLVSGFQAVATVLGPVISVISSVASVVLPIFTGAISAIADVISGLVALITGDFQGAIDFFKSAGGHMIDGLVQGIGAGIGAVTTAISTIGTAIIDFFKGLFGIHSPSTVFAGFGVNLLEGLVEGINSMIGAVLTVFSTIGTAIMTVWTAIWDGISLVVSNVFTFIIELVTGFGTNVMLGITTLITGISTLWTAGWSLLSTGVSTVFTFIVELVTTFATNLVLGITTMITGITTLWSAGWTAISTVVSTVFTFVSTLVTTFAVNVVAGITAIVTGIGAVWSAGWNFLTTIVSTVVSTVVAVVSGFIASVTAGISALVNSVKAVWSAGWNLVVSVVSGVIARIVGAIGGFAASISARVSGLVGSVKAIWSAGWNVVASVFSGIVGRISAAVSGFASRVSSGISSLIGRVKSVWSAGWNAVSSVMSGIVGRIGGLVSSLAGRVTSAISSLVGRVRSTWSAGWNAVTSAMSGVVGSISGAMGRLSSAVNSGISRAVGFFRSLPGKAVGALSGMAGSLAGVGRNVIQGLIGGMGSMIGAAVAKVRSIASSVANAAKGALGIKSPSRVFMAIGRDIVRGLDVGLSKNEILVVDRIKTITKNMLSQVDKLQEASRKKVSRPGKKATKKQWSAYRDAMGDKKEAAYQARKLKNAVAIMNKQVNFSAIYQKRVGKTKKFNAEYGLQRILNSFYNNGNAKNKASLKITLKDLEYARDRVETKLKTAKATLDARVKVRNDQSKQFSDKIRGEFGLGAAVDKYTEAGLRPTAKNLLGDANKVLARITKFRDKLNALKRAGYSATIIAEITNMGSEDGIIAADALLGASKSDKNKINSVYKSLDKVSNSIGLTTANAMYKTGIDSAAGLVRGLEADLRLIDNAGEKLGKRLVKAVNKQLGIKSPSRVFMGIGNYVGEGFIQGVDQVQGKIDKRMGSMVQTDFNDVRLSSKDRSAITNYKSQENNSNSPQIHVHPSANLDERAVGTIAANELGFRLYS